MPKLPKKISVVDSMAEFFFHLKTYLLGYGKIDFEGILGVPFFMVNLTPARCDSLCLQRWTEQNVQPC